MSLIKNQHSRIEDEIGAAIGHWMPQYCKWILSKYRRFQNRFVGQYVVSLLRGDFENQLFVDGK